MTRAPPRLPRPLAGRRSLRRPLAPGITSPASGLRRRASSSSKMSVSVRIQETDLSNEGKRINSTKKRVRQSRITQEKINEPRMTCAAEAGAKCARIPAGKSCHLCCHPISEFEHIQDDSGGLVFHLNEFISNSG